MIKRLSIQNFLSHKKTEMFFGPGINWVIGETDSGKSAIIRAIRWVWKNSPSGFAFRSRWAKKEKTVVISEFDDDVSVERIRSTSENGYILNEEPLSSFGTEPPQVVAEAINIDDTNVQRQGDQPFLLSLSPPEVARFLNSVANLADIDDAHTKVSGKMRMCDVDVVAETKRRDEAEQQLAKFAEIDNLQALADQARIIESAISGQKRERAVLKELIASLEAVENQIRILSEIPVLDDVAKDIDAVQEAQKERMTLHPLIERLLKAQTRFQCLQELSSVEEQLKTTRESIREMSVPAAEREALPRLISKYVSVETRIAAFRNIDNIGLDAALELGANLRKYTDERENLSATCRRLLSLTEQVETDAKNVTLAEKEKNDLMPDVCPLCGGTTCHHA